MNGRAPILPLAVGFLLGTLLSLGGFRAPVGALLTLPLALSPPLAPLAFLAAGWHAADLARASPPPAPSEALLEGRVASVPDPVGERLRFTLVAIDGRRLEVLAPPAEWPLAAGDRVRVRARLRTPPAARNPGAADPRERLAAVGVAQQAEALLPPVRVAPPSPLAWLERGRQRFADAATAALPEREAALVRAIGAGDRGGLDPATTDSFARSGLAHVLAVSGLHLVVVAAGLERLLRAALQRLEPLASRWDARRAAAALGLPVMAAYTIATGAGFPVVRAAVAAAATAGATLLDREAGAANLLGLAALAVLGAEPGALLDPSLQLSLASVAGLVALAGPLRGALPLAPARGGWRGWLLEPLLAGLCATLAASVATATVLALHFRRLPVLGVLANVVGVPIGTGLTALTALAAVLAAAWPPLALPALWACRPLATALLLVSDAAAAPDLAVLGVASPGPLLAAAACALALSLARLRGAWRWGGASALVACLVLPGPVRALAARQRGVLEVIFVSVGQGDCTLLRLPDGSAVLVDAGGTFPGGRDPGARDVVPLLRDLGITRLAAVVASHPHPDHVLGLTAVADAFPVDRFVLGGGPPTEGIAAALARLPAPTPLPPGGALVLGGVRLERVDGGDPTLEENDASLALRVTFGRTALLLTGDLEAAGEAAALAGGLPLRADLVKVPHHGSRTSSSEPFVRAVGATTAVASLGAGNRFGFPHPEAVARWTRAGAAWRQTDAGALRFLLDGERVVEVPAGDVLDPMALLREARR